MDIAVDVINQELRVTPENLRHFAPGSKNFVRFVFNLGSDWDGMTTLAQFAQDGVPYSIYLDGENSACLPREIGPGTCYLMLYGVNGTTKIGTTNRLTLYINDNHFVESASSTNLTPTLYEQLVSQIQAVKKAVGAPLMN